MATIFIPRETSVGETRVAATPETVQRLVRMNLTVTVQEEAGTQACFENSDYEAAGATISRDPVTSWRAADAILKVSAPAQNSQLTHHEADLPKNGAVVVAMFVPQDHTDTVERLIQRQATCFSLNWVPRITRAQKMDALSSQANIAGYKAALLAANALPKFFPLLMTAAGTVKPAKVVVMGAGVAGLQAIATARRIGAQVWATDVRLAAKEQVESLGAKFIDVPGMEDMEDASGYAREATPEFLQRQREIVAEHVAAADVVITTAQVPGKRAPVLIPAELVKRMSRGAVVVDLAAEQGGNCAATVAGQTIESGGVTIVGPVNVPATLPRHASELFARNVLAFFSEMVVDGAVAPNFDNEVLAKSLVTHAGKRHNAIADDELAVQEEVSS